MTMDKSNQEEREEFSWEDGVGVYECLACSPSPDIAKRLGTLYWLLGSLSTFLHYISTFSALALG